MKTKVKNITIICIILALLSVIGYYVVDNVFATVRVSGIMPEMSEQEMIEKSHLIVKGTFIDKSKAFSLEAVNTLNTSNFTDYYLKIEEVYRGELNVGDIVTVRRQGGFVGTVNVKSDIDPEISINDTVFVYLYQSNMGGGYETDENYYYILNGVFGMYKSFDNTLVNETTNNTLDISTVIPTIEKVNSTTPVDKDWVYREAAESHKYNLETGFITQDEYDAFIESSTKYARKIKTSIV